MSQHTSNYKDTFIEIAEDSPLAYGEMPPAKGETKTIAGLQFDMIYENPYKYTSDDVIFEVYAQKKAFLPAEIEAQREHFFSKGQPCMRASPLTKKYGWGLHANAEGKIAIYAADSEEYQRFLDNSSIKKLKAMRTSRK